MLNGLSLFSGIGGIDVALAPWVRTVAYCENEAFAQSVLFSRMSSSELDLAPIWDDVSTLGADDIPFPIDIIYGGFPCQDISVTGTGKGLEGERSGLFFEVIRLVKEIRPSFVFLENVPAIRTRGLERVIEAFTDVRYDCRWTTLSAAEFGAAHIRKRWFLLAYSNSVRLREERGQEIGNQPTPAGPVVDNSASETRIAPWTASRLVTPRVDRTGDGVPNKVDRARGLGNSVVPRQAQAAFERLMGMDTYAQQANVKESE